MSSSRCDSLPSPQKIKIKKCSIVSLLPKAKERWQKVHEGKTEGPELNGDQTRPICLASHFPGHFNIFALSSKGLVKLFLILTGRIHQQTSTNRTQKCNYTSIFGLLPLTISFLKKIISILKEGSCMTS